MKPTELWMLIQKAAIAWVDDSASSMGAAIAYYTVFSIAPLLIIVISIAGFVWQREAVEGEILAQLTDLIGSDGAAAIKGLIKSASAPGRGIVGTIIGVAILFVGATTVVAELQSALDRI